jgi:hypothetical protein
MMIIGAAQVGQIQGVVKVACSSDSLTEALVGSTWSSFLANTNFSTREPLASQP